MKAWPSFRLGLALAVRYRQVWLLLFAVNLAAGLVLAVLPTLALTSVAGHSLALRDAADGLDAWFVLETMLLPATEAILEGPGSEPELLPGLRQILLSGLVAALALPLLAWLPSAFVNGGLLLTYADALRPVSEGELPPRFRWRRFLWGCWHWFGAFVLLGGIQGAVLLLLLAAGLAAAASVAAANGVGSGAVLATAVALLGLVWLALMESTRALAVAGGTCHPLRAFGRACRFFFRRLPQLAGLYGLVLLLAAGLHALFRLGLLPLLPLDWWPLVLLIQQAFVFARLGTRLVRQAGLLALLD